MANTIRLKSSSVAGKIPTTTDLALRELAVNTTDGVLYLKKSVSGVESIVQIGAINDIDGGAASTVFTLNAFTSIDGGGAV